MDGKKMIRGGRNAQKRDSAETVIPSLSCGLNEEDISRSREKFGSNTLSAAKQKGFWSRFISNLGDPIIKILIVSLVINLIFTFSDSNPAESIGIAATVLISALVSTISEHSSGKAFDRLYQTLSDSFVRVIRNGAENDVPVSSLVRGDLVFLSLGDTVPADGIVMRGSVSCDEASLTGESKAVTKSADPHSVSAVREGAEVSDIRSSAAVVYRGSHIVSGSALMLVTAVGDRTVYGSIASELAADNTASPLKERLSGLAKTISKIGYVSAALIAAVSLADAFWFGAGKNPTVALSRLTNLHFVAEELISALTKAISIVVVAVPEGLPMMITVVLSSNMKRMLSSGVLVRRLVGIETSGEIDMLFTDKTGTLTTGKLSVSSFITPYSEYSSARACPTHISDALKKSCAVCSSVRNRTEDALSAFSSVRIRAENENNIIPFDSSRKYAAGLAGEKMYIRGAAEYLIPSCVSYLAENGTIRTLSDSDRKKLEDTISSHSSGCSRILLLAEGAPDSFEKLKNGGSLAEITLTLVGLYVIRDEIRREAKAAVRECREAGISVVMLTGDNAATAAAIARECGILTENYAVLSDKSALSGSTPLVVDGTVLRTMTDGEVTAILSRIRVISRVTPSDKSRLVRLAKSGGHITGMTGDGVNDAPALKSADVGFAMGSGTDIAREAGDIVITDDNFASITKAVLYGRTILSSIKKFITFQLTMNMAAVGVSVLGTVLGVDSPVTVIQMLWVNIIMDTLGSLAFAGEPPLPKYMKTPPVGRDDPILSRRVLMKILTTGAFAIAASMYFLFSPDIRHALGGDELSHLTRFFALFVFMGIFIAMCTRTESINLLGGIGKNRAFIVIMPAVAAVQLLIVYFGGEVFRCVPLSGKELAVCALFAFTVIPADAIIKSIGKIIGKKKTSV